MEKWEQIREAHAVEQNEHKRQKCFSPVSCVRALTDAFDVAVGISGGSGEGGQLADVSEDGPPVLGSLFTGFQVRYCEC